VGASAGARAIARNTLVAARSLRERENLPGHAGIFLADFWANLIQRRNYRARKATMKQDSHPMRSFIEQRH
jgi:hypothetical protein